MQHARANRRRFASVFAQVALGLLTVGLGCPAARADTPGADVVAQLQAYNPQSGNIPQLLQAVVPKLAPLYLRLAPGSPIQKGGPLQDSLGPSILDKLDASPGSLPMVVYQKEDGRLPAAFILSRYRGVTPAQMVYNFGQRSGVVKHPLVMQYFELGKPEGADASAWGPGATRKTMTGFFAVDMPFGAGLFGLRESYIFGEWDFVTLPNGIAVASFLNRPARPDERTRFAKFNDKKNKERVLEDDYYEGREYRLTSLLLPERDASGQVTSTVQVYFVRIVPALKPGTDLKGSGALARWIFARGAQEALITPVKLTRDEVERRVSGKN